MSDCVLTVSVWRSLGLEVIEDARRQREANGRPQGTDDRRLTHTFIIHKSMAVLVWWDGGAVGDGRGVKGKGWGGAATQGVGREEL